MHLQGASFVSIAGVCISALHRPLQLQAKRIDFLGMFHVLRNAKCCATFLQEYRVKIPPYSPPGGDDKMATR